jgi:broad specificity phosphatase PhoE
VLRLYLVRHAEPQVDPGQPFDSWPLTAAGQAAARRLAETLPRLGRVIASPELKALETAQQLADAWGTEVVTDNRLREVAGRAWAESEQAYRQQVRSYFGGDEPDGWEPAQEARVRIIAAFEEVMRGTGDAALVSHGLVLTLLRSWFDGVQPAMLIPVWEAMPFPDVCILDSDAGRVLREVRIG